MYETFYRASSYLVYPLASAFFFVGFFVAVIAWVSNGRRRAAWDHDAALPLNDTPHTSHSQEP